MNADRAGKFDAGRAAMRFCPRHHTSRPSRTEAGAPFPGCICPIAAEALREAFAAGVEASAAIAVEHCGGGGSDHSHRACLDMDRKEDCLVAAEIRALLEKGRGE